MSYEKNKKENEDDFGIYVGSNGVDFGYGIGNNLYLDEDGLHFGIKL